MEWVVQKVGRNACQYLWESLGFTYGKGKAVLKKCLVLQQPFLHVPSLALLPRSSMPHVFHPTWKASTAQ